MPYTVWFILYLLRTNMLASFMWAQSTTVQLHRAAGVTVDSSNTNYTLLFDSFCWMVKLLSYECSLVIYIQNIWGLWMTEWKWSRWFGMDLNGEINAHMLFNISWGTDRVAFILLSTNLHLYKRIPKNLFLSRLVIVAVSVLDAQFTCWHTYTQTHTHTHIHKSRVCKSPADSSTTERWVLTLLVW